VKETDFFANRSLAANIQQCQFMGIRAKAASEIIGVKNASRLLGHTEQQITETVYRRIGGAVKPTK
jgi:integrase